MNSEAPGLPSSVLTTPFVVPHIQAYKAEMQRTLVTSLGRCGLGCRG